jgi:hypothetical protein
LSKVAVLDPLVAQQVAAAEVADRPASMVKELSETVASTNDKTGVLRPSEVQATLDAWLVEGAPKVSFSLSG